MIKRILVGLGDVEHSAVAVRHAIELCKRHGAELTAVTVVDHRRLDNVGPVPIGGGAAAHDLREFRLRLTREVIEHAIEQCEEQCREAEITFRLVFEDSDPLDAICHSARFHDLMILGRENTLFDHGVIDEPTDQLVRLVQEGVRPLLTVPHEATTFKHALVAFSGSMESAKTIRQLVQLRPWPEMDMHIVTFGRPEEKAKRDLDDVEDYCRAHGVPVTTEYRSGSAKADLLPLADERGADLLVVGNSARSLLMRRLFGETVLHVIRNADRALFLSQ